MAFNCRMIVVLENSFKNPLLWLQSLANSCCASVPSSLLGPSLSEFKKRLDDDIRHMVGLSCDGSGADPVDPFQLRICYDSRETSTTSGPRKDVSSSRTFYLCQLGAGKWVSTSEIYSFALIRTLCEVPCFSCFPDFQARPPGGQNISEKQDERISSPSAVPSLRHHLGR